MKLLTKNAKSIIFFIAILLLLLASAAALIVWGCLSAKNNNEFLLISLEGTIALFLDFFIGFVLTIVLFRVTETGESKRQKISVVIETIKDIENRVENDIPELNAKNHKLFWNSVRLVKKLSSILIASLGTLELNVGEKQSICDLKTCLDNYFSFVDNGYYPKATLTQESIETVNNMKFEVIATIQTCIVSNLSNKNKTLKKH